MVQAMQDENLVLKLFDILLRFDQITFFEELDGDLLGRILNVLTNINFGCLAASQAAQYLILTIENGLAVFPILTLSLLKIFHKCRLI